MKPSAYRYVILGLGNPGKEYEHTRHNAGRAAVLLFAATHGSPTFETHEKTESLVSEYTFGTTKILLVLPETYVNKSGNTANALNLPIKSVPEKLVVLQDDLDLPLGSIKIVKNRGSAGHKGVESVMRALKTPNFTRIRIGIAKASTIRKSQSDSVVMKTVIGKIPPEEKLLLKKGIKKAASALSILAEHGVERAMNECNS